MHLFLLFAITLSPLVSANRLLDSAKAPKPSATGGKQIFDTFLPLCLLVEPGAGNAEELARGLVEQAARCGVLMRVGVRYVSGIPASPKNLSTLTRAARARCNAARVFASWGVQKTSVAVVLRDPAFARALCEVEGTDLRSCGEYATAPEGSIASRMASTGQGGKVAPSGFPAVSLIAQGVPALRDIHTWALGIALFGMPRGSGMGMGVGLPDEGYAGAGSGNDLGWTSEGCRALKRAAVPNRAGYSYDPAQPLEGFEPRLLPLDGPENLFSAP